MQRRYFLNAFNGVIVLLAAAGTNALAAQSSRSYAAPYDKVWRATLAAVDEVGLERLSADRAKGVILARKGVRVFSWGEKVRIDVRRMNARSTRVEVANQRNIAGNVLGPEWDERLLEALDKRL